METSLYEKYGGFATVSAIVHEFYDRVLGNPVLAPYFDGIEIDRLVQHQTTFFCKVLGGPDNYAGRDLAASHKRLNVTAEAFAEVGRVLAETLTDQGVDADDVAGVMRVVESVRDQVVATSPEASR